MSSSPLISVIIPVYNAEKYISQALESVFSQTFNNIEVICINDGSTDTSFEILKRFGAKIRLLDNGQNCGAGETRNKGVAVARGEFLAFLDADDIWETEKLKTQMFQFQKNANLDISFSYMKCFTSPELSDEAKGLRYCPADPILGHCPGATVIKTESFKKVGLFNPKWKVGEFIDWFSRAKEIGLNYDIVPEVFLLRRIHETNTGITARASRKDYAKIVRESLARRRNQNQ